MKWPLNRKWTIISVIIFLFVVLNPGLKTFESYRDGRGSRDYYADRLPRRDYNFFLFSVYSHEEKKFLGVLGNFIYLGD